MVKIIFLLFRISRVCQKWHAVASHPSLWCLVDLSYLAINSAKANDETLALMSKRNIFKYIQELNLNSWSKLTNLGLEVEYFFHSLSGLITTLGSYSA